MEAQSSVRMRLSGPRGPEPLSAYIACSASSLETKVTKPISPRKEVPGRAGRRLALMTSPYCLKSSRKTSSSLMSHVILLTVTPQNLEIVIYLEYGLFRCLCAK
jgi:hypothetical protein